MEAYARLLQRAESPGGGSYRQPATELLAEFEAREQVQLVFLQRPPDLELPGATLSAVLATVHIRLPNPEDR